MAGIENNIVFGGGFKLQGSSARDISDMQRTSTDVSNINYIGNPETNVSANPSSFCHDTSTGIVYYKFTGTGNTGWVPIFQPLPQKITQMTDDFLGTTQQIFQNSGLNVPALSQPGHPGLLMTNYADIAPTPLENGFYAGDLVNPYQYIIVGGGILSVSYVINLSTLSVVPNNYISYFGLTDTLIITEPNGIQNGIWFSYTDSVNSGNWTLNSASAGVVTSVDSTVPATTNFVNLTFKTNAAGTVIEFLIDNSSVGTINTNIPSVNLIPFMNWSLYGTDPNSLIDLFSLSYLLTNSR